MTSTALPSASSQAIVIEAALLCAGRPLALQELTALFAGELPEAQVRATVVEVGARWVLENRGFELVGDDSGWKVSSTPDMAEHLGRMETRQRHKYSSAVLETLAVIAYLQPCTRTTIEEHRQRAVTPGVLDQLLERRWVEIIGHQESPGRPALYATTFKFLDDLGLMTIADLPPLDAPAEPDKVASPGESIWPDPDDPWEGEDSYIRESEPIAAGVEPAAELAVPNLVPASDTNAVDVPVEEPPAIAAPVVAADTPVASEPAKSADVEHPEDERGRT